MQSLFDVGRYELSLDLHDDADSSGYYQYQTLDSDEESKASDFVLRRVNQVMPINRDRQIEGRPAQNGVIRRPCAPPDMDWWPIAVYALEHGVKHNFTLEVGCGTGHFTRWLAERGLWMAGLDLSWPMLLEARRLQSPSCLQGDAEALPFPNQSVDLVVLITTLEFVENPPRVLEEAVRVARQGLLLGVLNRRSFLARRYRASGKSLWQAAHFFSVGELKRLVMQAAGERLLSVRWRTTLWPIPHLPDAPLPWGGFIGLAVQLDGEKQERSYDRYLGAGQFLPASSGAHIAGH